MIKSFSKFTILILFTALISQNDIFSQPSDYIGYWKLDGDATDSSINEINGNPSVNVNYNNGIDGEAAIFDYSGYNYIDLGNDPYLNLNGSITISAWIKLDVNYPSTHQMIISKHGTSWYASIYNQKVFLSVAIDGDQTYTEGSIKVSPDQWHHIACSWNASTGEYKTYIDGVLDVNAFHPGNGIKVTNKNAHIGVYDANQLGFSGAIDELLIYDRALSHSEINYLKENPSIINQESELWKVGESNIFHLGNVAIGTSKVPAGSNLAVDGNITTKEVNVTLDQWPDFVFEPSHELMSIEQLETFINHNHHLPSIPSEKEVKKNGVNLGEMDSKLLEKIEELTLYIIEQNRRLKKLEDNNILLSKEINILRNKTFTRNNQH